eukprot:CFRG8074T1
MAVDEIDERCCVIEKKNPCGKAAGTYQFPKRIARFAQTKQLGLEVDESIGHSRVCSEHKSTLLQLKKTLDLKKKKSTEGAATTVDFSTVQHSVLKKYRKCFNLDVPVTGTKQDYSTAVTAHFPTISVNEAKDILAFISHVQNMQAREEDVGDV